MGGSCFCLTEVLNNVNGWEIVLVVLLFGVLPGLALGFYGGRLQTQHRYDDQMRQQKETAEARMLDIQQQQRDALR